MIRDKGQGTTRFIVDGYGVTCRGKKIPMDTLRKVIRGLPFTPKMDKFDTLRLCPRAEEDVDDTRKNTRHTGQVKGRMNALIELGEISWTGFIEPLEEAWDYQNSDEQVDEMGY